MAKNETDVSHQIMLALAKKGTTLFKNVRGVFLTLDGKRKTIAGCGPNGASDLIGFTQKIITPEDVGRTYAIFTAIEVKHKKGRPSPDQQKFCAIIRDKGGLSGVAWSVEDAEQITQLNR